MRLDRSIDVSRRILKHVKRNFKKFKDFLKKMKNFSMKLLHVLKRGILSQQFLHFGRDGTTFCKTSQFLGSCTHYFAHIFRTFSAYFSDDGFQSCFLFLCAHLLWQVSFDNSYLCQFSFSQVRTALFGVKCSRILALFYSIVPNE